MKTTRNPWPYGIIATFVIFISGTIGLIVMASTQKVDLVSKNYYEQEIKYQTRMDDLDRTKPLGATAAYDVAGRRIVISLPAAHAGKNVAGTIQFYRPSAAGMDQQIKLEPDANGVQTFDAANLQQGLWKIRVAWNIAGQEYFLDQKIVISPAVVARGVSPL
jgi:nitrogen fixation protein FixH